MRTHPCDSSARSPGRHLTAVLVAISLACAGVAGEVSATAGARGAELWAPANAGSRSSPLAFVVPSSSEPEIVPSRDDGPGAGSLESRHRLHRPTPSRAHAAEWTAHSVREAEGRRLNHSPGLARAGAGRLTQFATAPPKPVA